MKKLLLILVLFASCKKEIQQEQLKISQQVTESITTTSTTPYFLYVVEDEDGWAKGKAGLFNITGQRISFTTANLFLSQQYGGKVLVGSPIKLLSYPCLIGNGIPGNTWDTTENNPITRSGVKDFAVNGDGSESVPVEIFTYVNGDIFLGRKKDEFDYSPTDARLGACAGINYSGKDFTWWGWGDTYFNSAIVPNTPDTTFAVIAVLLHYNLQTINPAVGLLPLRIVGTTAVVDTSAIYKNAANPATNYKALLQRGKIKGVNITWQGNGYAYCIEKYNDATGLWDMILKWSDSRSFFDPSGNRFSRYKVITRALGRIPDAETQEFKVSTK